MSRVPITRALRELVAAQARCRCGYCLTQERIIGSLMDIEHIVPVALGGLTEEDNLWLACGPCNAHKSDRVQARDPATGEMARLYDPRHQVWNEHFAWSPESDVIVGLTPAGRATVVALNLNRTPLVLARNLWVRAGWHPPED